MRSGYETVVVGAGSAGAAIAAIGSEAREVLLVESGPDYPQKNDLPRDLADGGRNALVSHDWRYRHRRAPGRSTFMMPRGRVVGGSSAVNTCIALRGTPADYDEWDLEPWRFEECRSAFVALERDLDFSGPTHGNDGAIPIRRHPRSELVPWQAGFLDACETLGLPFAADANDFESSGAGPMPMNKVDGRRISAAEGYITPAVRARSSFTLSASTHVHRVLIENGHVRGLEVERDGAVERITTDRVILSAGAINTPAILLRSGVGPRADVERIGVELVADVPGVGHRLLDHPGTAIFFRPKRGGLVRGAPLIQTVLRFDTGRGPKNDILLQPGSVVPLPRFELPLMSLMVSIGKPKGHGRLRFPSADPYAKPIIDSMLFENADDLADAVKGFLLARDLAATPALSNLGAHFLPRRRTFDDPQKLAAWIRFGCDSGYHPCGTVPMGGDHDPLAATDAYGRVRGVRGLFVADASSFPTIPSCNINIPTLMLGHRFGTWLRDRVLDA